MRADLAPAREIFLAAAEMSAVERPAYLDHACGTDIDLRQRVNALLQAHDNQAGATGDFPPPQPASPIDGGIAGEHIGPYKLLQKLGDGGMGSVWLAEQSEPVRRRVALKVIKAGMDSALVVARFEAERQALALMDHPNIAKILDAGTTPAGKPYFVMELVKGIPITKYCDQEHLTPTERLELFIPVCQAVQHAHQKGIIHRDLKPSNIIVGLYDGRPVSKVIDFGVAKATGQRLTDRTVFTEIGNIIGTLEYMAPEQAELNNLDIDSRADVYSLGVILYELLAGEPPFASSQLRGAAFTEMLRIIREVEPSKPSTKLSSSNQLPSIAANRKLEPKRLAKIVHGELDWVVMKCLEKQRDRRYATANGLARDIQRYLADESVEARPPTAGYRMMKVWRRNKGAIIAAGLVVFALLVGMAGTSWGMWRATQSAEGERQAKQDAITAKVRAEEREAETAAVLKFVEDRIFVAARPQDMGREVKLIEAVTQSLPQVESGFSNQPLIEARLRKTLGTSFWYLGEPQTAAEQFRRANHLYTAKLGADHPDALGSTMGVANCFYDLGRHVEALKLREETLANQRAKLGADHADTLTSLNNLANSYHALGRHAEAVSLFEEALSLRKAKLGADHPDTLSSMNNLAVGYGDLGRQAEATKLHEHTLALRKVKLGADHPDTLWSMNNLAKSFYDQGRRPEATKLFEDALTFRKTKLGTEHPDTLSSMNNLAVCYGDLGRHDDAVKLNEQVLAMRKAKLGANHPDTLWSMNNLANKYHDVGRAAEALKLHEEGLALRKTKLGTEHPDTLTSMNNVAWLYSVAGRHAEAISLHEQTLALRTAKLGADHPDTLWSMSNLAASYWAVGRHAETLRLRESILTIRNAKLGPNHPDTIEVIYNIACFHALMIDKTDNRTKQADLDMDWLKQAVVAGFINTAHMKKDTDLDTLREREDFKKLIAELETAAPKKPVEEEKP